MFSRIVIFFVLIVVATPVQAAYKLHVKELCHISDEINKQLRGEKYQETPTFSFMSNDNEFFTVYLSDKSNTWTLVRELGDSDIYCIVAAGENGVTIIEEDVETTEK